MITLEADNRLLTQSAKYSYLSTNYASGVSSLVVTNANDGFSVNRGTVTISVASPAVITKANHGFILNDIVYFTVSSGGALPTGLTANTLYYVISAGLATNTFEVSATPGGAAVNTTLAGSGTYTVHKMNGNYLLLGNIGSESAEIVKIATINTTTHTFTTSSASKFAHAESTKVTLIPYNKVEFYWTATESWAATTPLPVSADHNYIDIQVSDWFTTFDDESHDTGYGWYLFYNETTGIYSDESNALPYEGFDNDTVEDVLNDFFALLNNKELKLVTRRDALSWLNEGYSIIRNKLNLANVEYSASALSTLTTTSGTYEYALPSNFYRMVSITSDLDGTDPTAMGNYSKYGVEYIPLRQAFGYTGSSPRYYIRGAYIGILPTPTGTTTYHYMYLTKTSRLNSNSEIIDLPDNGFYAIKDFMMYRAYMKFNNPNAITYYKMFQENMNQMILAATDRDCNLDSFTIDECANV